MLYKDNQAIIKHNAHAINIFEAYVDLNITGLVDIIHKTMADEDGQVNLNTQAALGLAITFIGEIAEQNYSQFCTDHPEEILIEPNDANSIEIGNTVVQKNVKGTLSEIVNVLQLICINFTKNINQGIQEHPIFGISELNGSLTILRSIKSAAALCAQTILKSQHK